MQINSQYYLGKNIHIYTNIHMHTQMINAKFFGFIAGIRKIQLR